MFEFLNMTSDDVFGKPERGSVREAGRDMLSIWTDPMRAISQMLNGDEPLQTAQSGAAGWLAKAAVPPAPSPYADAYADEISTYEKERQRAYDTANANRAKP